MRGAFSAAQRHRLRSARGSKTKEHGMADHGRAAKLGDSIKEIVAKRLEKGLRDPRLGFVTITDVRMTGDLQHASIFFTVYGTEQEREDSAAALKAATAARALAEGAQYAGEPDPYVKPREADEE
jgi:ribosome-binding factor A